MVTPSVLYTHASPGLLQTLAECASLCRLLLADGIEAIALNVRADNAAAIASYTRLGFEPVAEYVEASLVARTVGG